MAVSTFYLNSPSLESATAVFTNAAMTILAADGFYQQDNIVRELVGGVLQPQATCESCATPCDEPIQAVAIPEHSEYRMSINLESGTGAVIIRFNPFQVPLGIRVVFNSVVYNKLSSPTYGYLAAPSGLTTYIGEDAEDCGIAEEYTTSTYNLDVAQYNGTLFEITGEIHTVDVDSSQIQTTATTPGECIMVIPKVVSSPTVVQVTVFAICEDSFFDIEVECPANLTSFSCGARKADAATACAEAMSNTYYVAHVNGAAGTLGLNDWVFSDINGQYVLIDGYYRADAAVPGSDDFFVVQNGLVQSFGNC